MSVIARDCVFFYGHNKGEHACFSQFSSCEFYDGNRRYTCAEQYMMASKARAMGDEESLQNILACGYDPKSIKALGRMVSPYDDEKWSAVRLAAVARGNFLKFSQSKRLRKILLGTGNLTLVEAAPNDRIWGIGISVQDAAKGAKWKGQNLLGQALMMARRAIEAGEEIPPPVFATAAAAAAEKKDEAGATADASVGGASGVGGEQPDGDADEPMPEVKKQRSR